MGPDSKLTLRPPPSASTALPSSLRLLFPEEGHVASHSFSTSHGQESLSITPAPSSRAMDQSTVPSPRPGLALSALQLTSRPTKHDDSKAGTSDVKDKSPDNRTAISMAKVCSPLSQTFDNT